MPFDYGRPCVLYMQAIKTLSGKALRAMCSLLSITRKMEVPLNIMLDSFVWSILCYASEI